jgi:hypothetical protein
MNFSNLYGAADDFDDVFCLSKFIRKRNPTLTKDEPSQTRAAYRRLLHLNRSWLSLLDLR